MNGNGIKWTILSEFDEYENDYLVKEIASNECIEEEFEKGKMIVADAEEWLKANKGKTYEIEFEEDYEYKGRIKLQAVEDFNLMDNAVFLEPCYELITDKNKGTEAITVRGLIQQLESIARQYGDDTKVCFSGKHYGTFINDYFIFPYDKIKLEKEED